MKNPKFHIRVEEVESGETQIGAFPAEARNRGGSIVQFLKTLGTREIEKKLLVSGIQISDTLGAKDVVLEAENLVVGERTVERNESSHGFSSVETEDTESRRSGFVLEEELKGVIGSAFD